MVTIRNKLAEYMLHELSTLHESITTPPMRETALTLFGKAEYSLGVNDLEDAVEELRAAIQLSEENDNEPTVN